MGCRPLRNLIAMVLTGLAACSQTPPPDAPIRVTDALGEAPAEGFARALAPRPFVFPADHGPHPDFRNEWWYLTGNLADDQGHRFGYQVTFFRIGLQAHPAPRSSHWATSQVFLAHAAVTDMNARRHLAAERFSREALGLAGARVAPLRVWVDDWTLSASEAGFPWTLRVDDQHFALDLEISALRPPVPQGQDGLSRRSDQPGNASYYYSITRLRTAGAVRIDEEDHPVSGLSWLDREWATRPLGPRLAGWDWLSLQLNDGTDFMFYRLREHDGSTAPQSAGLLLSKDGTRQALGVDDVTLSPVRFWAAPDGTLYPVAWTVDVRPLGKRWRVEAALDDQRMDLGLRYWEGAVRALGPESADLVGRGYLEMTGYEPSAK